MPGVFLSLLPLQVSSGRCSPPSFHSCPLSSVTSVHLAVHVLHLCFNSSLHPLTGSRGHLLFSPARLQHCDCPHLSPGQRLMSSYTQVSQCSTCQRTGSVCPVRSQGKNRPWELAQDQHRACVGLHSLCKQVPCTTKILKETG